MKRGSAVPGAAVQPRVYRARAGSVCCALRSLLLQGSAPRSPYKQRATADRAATRSLRRLEDRARVLGSELASQKAMHARALSARGQGETQARGQGAMQARGQDAIQALGQAAMQARRQKAI
eukprot:4090383-Pleurochrysis_carterae.AAC.1